MFVLTFVSIVLILPRGKARRIVDGLNVDVNNWDPFLYVSKDLEESPNYDITRWVRQLHLQQCAFVEIGEGFCAFCEEIGPWTSIPAELNSLWSRWSSPKCNSTCGRGFMVAIATCQDQREASHRLHRAWIILVSQQLLEEITSSSLPITKGVNCSSCPDSFAKCYCEVNIADGIMRAARFTEPCISTEGCIPSSAGTFTFEGELDPGSSIDFDEVYENDDRERFEDTILCPESARPARHLLQAYSRDAEYGLRENRLANKKLRNARGYRPVLRRRLNDDDDDYQDEDDAEEGDSEEDAPGYDDKVDEEEDDEEDGGEETVTDEEQGRYYDYGNAKGRRGPRKRTREARSDYAEIASGGKPEVDEPAKGPMEIGSVTDDCEEDTTEPLQYYDYDAGGSVSIRGRAPLIAELVALNVLLRLLGC